MHNHRRSASPKGGALRLLNQQNRDKLSTFNNEEIKQEIEKLKKQIKDLTNNSKK